MPPSQRPPTAEFRIDPAERAARAMDAICFADSTSRRILDVNARWSHLFGHDRDDARQLTLDDVTAEARLLHEALRAGESGDLLDAVRGIWRRSDGAVFSAHFSIASLGNGYGQPAKGRRAGRDGPASVLCLSIRDPDAPTEIPAKLARQVQRTTRQQAALVGLSELTDVDFDERLRQILRVDAYTLAVGQVSYWSLQHADDVLLCEARFLKNDNRYEDCAEARKTTSLARYIETLSSGAVLAIEDARRSEAAREIDAEGSFERRGVGALLCVPVFIRGELVGAIHHEHVGSRRPWKVDEQLFAMSVAQTCALAIEGHHRALAEAAMRDSEARFRAIVEASPVPMLVTARDDGRCLYGNAAAAAALGVPVADLLRYRAHDFYAEPTERGDVLARLTAEGFIRQREMLLRRQDDGSTFWTIVSIRPVSFAGQAALVVGFSDITERKRMEQTLRHMALHDPLTGLPNRAMFYEVLRREMAHARRTPDYSFAVLFIDLDDFKTINDRFGHEAGDTLLISIANRLRSCLRPRDAVARLGGDEFTVLLAKITAREEALGIVERIATVVRMPHHLGSASATPSVSIGVVIRGESYEDPDVLLHDADTAMYRAKDLGKSRYEVF